MLMEELKKMGSCTNHEPTRPTQVAGKWWQDRFWKRIAIAVVVLLALLTAISFYAVYSSMQETNRLSSTIYVPKMHKY